MSLTFWLIETEIVILQTTIHPYKKENFDSEELYLMKLPTIMTETNMYTNYLSFIWFI